MVGRRTLIAIFCAPLPQFYLASKSLPGISVNASLSPFLCFSCFSSLSLSLSFFICIYLCLSASSPIFTSHEKTFHWSSRKWFSLLCVITIFCSLCSLWLIILQLLFNVFVYHAWLWLSWEYQSYWSLHCQHLAQCPLHSFFLIQYIFFVQIHYVRNVHWDLAKDIPRCNWRRCLSNKYYLKNTKEPSPQICLLIGLLQSPVIPY